MCRWACLESHKPSWKTWMLQDYLHHVVQKKHFDLWRQTEDYNNKHWAGEMSFSHAIVFLLFCEINTKKLSRQSVFFCLTQQKK